DPSKSLSRHGEHFAFRQRQDRRRPSLPREQRCFAEDRTRSERRHAHGLRVPERDEDFDVSALETVELRAFLALSDDRFAWRKKQQSRALRELGDGFSIE